MITQRILLSEVDSSTLRKIQSNLKKLGYYNDKIDGIYGRNTGEGFAKWKADNWIAETTYIGVESFNQLQQQADAVKVIDWTDFKCKISQYFTVGEVAQGLTNDGRFVQYRERLPKTDVVKNNALRLAAELDKVREDWGGALAVTSWYRPPAVNRAVKGARNSRHLNGSAVDVTPLGNDVYKFQKWLDKRWDMSLGYGAKKGFVHLDLSSPGQRIRWNY
jgi:putative chitinase